jgi:hypothetical protein
MSGKEKWAEIWRTLSALLREILEQDGLTHSSTSEAGKQTPGHALAAGMEKTERNRKIQQRSG